MLPLLVATNESRMILPAPIVDNVLPPRLNVAPADVPLIVIFKPDAVTPMLASPARVALGV